MKKFITLVFVAVFFGCQEKAEKITDSNDYNKYLITSNIPSKDAIDKDYEFWQEKFKNDSTSLMEMSQLSGIHAALFGSTGDISQLKISEKLILESSNKEKSLRTANVLGNSVYLILVNFKLSMIASQSKSAIKTSFLIPK